VRRGVDDGEVYSASLGLLEQSGNLTGIRRDGVELHAVRSALVPLEGTTLRVDVDNGCLELPLRRADRHMDGEGSFAAAAFLRQNR
jgi:hypothetical protein